MIRLSRRGAAIYALLSLATLMALIFALGVFLSALVENPQVKSLANLAFELALLASFAAVGMSLSGEKGEIRGMWRVGMALAVVSLPLSHITDSARAFQLHVAFALPALCCVYWLFSRFSRMDAKWSRDSLRTCATLQIISGGTIALGQVGIPQPLAAIAAPLVLLAQIIIASHWHKALCNRDANATLSPHWLALATLLLVVNGIIGALSVQPGIQAAMRGADMARAQDWLAGMALLCVALAVVNQSASELRGDNRRVTGYMAFWLVGFGGILAAVCQMGLGILQHYLGANATSEILMPMTALWTGCLGIFAAGMAIYALGFLARLPRIHIHNPDEPVNPDSS